VFSFTTSSKFFKKSFPFVCNLKQNWSTTHLIRKIPSLFASKLFQPVKMSKTIDFPFELPLGDGLIFIV